MKNLIKLFFILIMGPFAMAQVQLTPDNINYYTADLAEGANYATLEKTQDKQGNKLYPGFVEALKRVARGLTTNSSRYIELHNHKPGYAMVAEIDPSRARNRLYKYLDKGMTVISPHLNGHKMVYDTITGTVALANCGNIVVDGRVYHFPIKGAAIVDNGITIPTTPSNKCSNCDTQTTVRKDPCNNCDNKLEEDYNLQPKNNRNLGKVLGDRDLVKYNTRHRVDYTRELGFNDFKKEKKSNFWKNFLIGTGAAIGTFILADGIADGEWFEWTNQPFTRNPNTRPIVGSPTLDPSAATFGVSVQNTQFGTSFGAGINYRF